MVECLKLGDFERNLLGTKSSSGDSDTQKAVQNVQNVQNEFLLSYCFLTYMYDKFILRQAL